MRSVQTVRTLLASEVGESSSFFGRHELVPSLWEQATSTNSYASSRLRALLIAKCPAPAVEQLIRVLVRACVDPTNSWTLSYVMLDLLGFASTSVLNVDLSTFRRLLLTRERNDAELARSPQKNLMQLDEYGPSLERSVRTSIERMRDHFRCLVHSDASHSEVSSIIGSTQDEFYAEVVRHSVLASFERLGVASDTQAFIYFRHVKTFASDFDFVYVGPHHDEVVMDLARTLLYLGIKPDLPTAYIVRAKALQQDPALLHLFFFDGRVVEFGAPSFPAFIGSLWPDGITHRRCWTTCAQPRLEFELAIWNGRQSDSNTSLRRWDLRKLQYRAITNLLFGLTPPEHMCDFSMGSRSLWEILSVATRTAPGYFRDILDLVALVRSLLQLRTGRRWYVLDESDKAHVAHWSRLHGLVDVWSRLEHVGRELESLYRQHFGFVEVPARYAARFSYPDETWAMDATAAMYRRLAEG